MARQLSAIIGKHCSCKFSGTRQFERPIFAVINSLIAMLIRQPSGTRGKRSSCSPCNMQDSSLRFSTQNYVHDLRGSWCVSTHACVNLSERCNVACSRQSKCLIHVCNVTAVRYSPIIAKISHQRSLCSLSCVPLKKDWRLSLSVL